MMGFLPPIARGKFPLDFSRKLLSNTLAVFRSMIPIHAIDRKAVVPIGTIQGAEVALGLGIVCVTQALIALAKSLYGAVRGILHDTFELPDRDFMGVHQKRWNVYETFWEANGIDTFERNGSLGASYEK
jgi:hypothetical protein